MIVSNKAQNYYYRFGSWIQLRCKCGRFLSKGQHKHECKLCAKCEKIQHDILHNEYGKSWNKEHRKLCNAIEYRCRLLDNAITYYSKESIKSILAPILKEEHRERRKKYMRKYYLNNNYISLPEKEVHLP